MAEVEIELKDEELVDFDGSDYEFGSDEGLGIDEDIDYRGSNAVDDASIRNGAPAESGEIQEEKKDEALGRGSALDASERNAGAAKMPESKKHSATKTDLEDGEFFDMATTVNSKKQTEHGVVKDVKQSRKHSNDSMRDFTDREAERNADSRHDRKRRKDYDYERHQYGSRDRKEPYERHMGRYERSHGSSERRHDRFGGFSDPRTRGPRNAQPFRPNLCPGIMGPGRPLPPPEVNQIRASTAGLEIFSPAQLQELLNQEHILRSQQMLHFARLGIRPPGGQPLYPLLGPNFLRPPLQPAGSLNFGPLDVQGPRSNFGRGPGILGGVFGLMRPPNNIKNEVLPLGSGRGQPRPPATAEQGPEQAAQAIGESGGNVGTKHSTRHKQDAQGRRGQDVHRRSDRYSESRSKRLPVSSGTVITERDDRERLHSAPSKANEPAYNSGNLIQLGGPVQKSRVLTVSGLSENTPMSAVADAFEKQGKILDFRKNQKGDVFTITFSTVQEALSAKRHLHRSMLAGRQITVEYAV